MISLMIILALVTVPLVLIARLSFTVLARLLGVVSQSEVATRAEFARIREQLLATAGDVGEALDGAARQPDLAVAQVGGTGQLGGAAIDLPRATVREQTPARPEGRQSAAKPSAAEPTVAEWRRCPTCTASVSSTASMCLQCGAGLSSKY
jgi:hypothetical protein